ncbi:MAG: ACT domain-containing protein [Armatimonadota bacterium]
MHLTVLPGRFAVCSLPVDAAMPLPVPSGILWSVTKTRDELSLVCDSSDAPSNALAVERDWSALAVAGPLDFSLVGILAALTAPLAAAEISIFALSTFETDYILVKEKSLARAITTLEEAGHIIRKETL